MNAGLHLCKTALLCYVLKLRQRYKKNSGLPNVLLKIRYLSSY